MNNEEELVDEHKIKDALDQVAYVDGQLTVDNITYDTALRYNPILAKYLFRMPEIRIIDSNVIFKIGTERKCTFEILGNKAQITIHRGTFGTSEMIWTGEGDLDEANFKKFLGCK